jgi:outer membrane protein OmpA-like peptidoglycan-associated protein
MARAVDGSKTRLYRASTPGERWWFAFLLVPTLLTVLFVTTRGDAVEAELEQQALVALQEAGLVATQVEMAGRNATLLVPTGESSDLAVQAVGTVDGIGRVSAEHVARSAREARACERLQQKVDAAADGNGIIFAGASTTLASPGTTQAIAKLLVRCPSATVVAEGHTDASVVGGATISLRRAEAVRNALVKAGVQAERVTAKGFGDTYPASAKDTPAGRALNNRVVVTVTED